MAKLTAPVKDFNGFIGDVEFKDGVAETDNEVVIAYARKAGYGVDGSKPKDEETAIFLDGPLHEADEVPRKLKHGPFTKETVQAAAKKQGKKIPKDTHLVSPDHAEVDAADPEAKPGGTVEPADDAEDADQGDAKR